MYVFRKPGFQKRQSEKLKDVNSRKAILVDANIVNDSKILMLHEQRDYTLFPLYLHILSKLDLQTESWEVREDEFRSWFLSTFKVSNRFALLSRLQWLSNAGLIEFYSTPNEVLTESCHVPNDVLTESYTLLETAETPVSLHATKTKLSEAKLSEGNAPPEFQKSVTTAEDYANRSPNNQNTSWVASYLLGFYVRNREQYAALTNQQIHECWEKACHYWDSKGPGYIKTAFEGKLRDALASPEQPLASKQSFQKPKPEEKSQYQLADEKLVQMMTHAQWRHRWRTEDVISTCDLVKRGNATVEHPKEGFLTLNEWIPVEVAGSA
jgi:hypothetical protein